MYIQFASPRVSYGDSKQWRKTLCTLICGMTTLSPSETASQKENFAALPQLARDEEGPVFQEPWQAQAFALAVKLSENGHFTWKEWSATLADELKAAADRGEPDDGSHYYHHWLAALEHLVASKRLSDPAAMLARKEAWAEAYRRTPHGKPVELAGGTGSKATG
jgi:nitrile hydratase accessory protein